MSKVVRVIVMALLAIGLVVPVWAQQGTTGRITGTVKDETGAVVPGAAIVVTDIATRREVAKGTSGPDGTYTISLLPAGRYSVGVRAPGFGPAESPNVEVKVTETTTVPFTMHLGQVTQQVTVTEAASPLQLGGATTGQTVTNVGDLPQPTRNILGLLALNPGAVSDLPDTAALGRGNFSIEVNGQRATNNNYQIEGMNANDYNLGQFTNVPVPNPSAVAEFRTATSLYDASQGRNGGGLINVQLKSGGSRLHGDVFEFFRNDALNANDFFLNMQGAPRPILKQNQFGGSIGGPIPKTGAFFFMNYQGTRQRSGLANGTQLNTLITALPVDRSAASLASAFGVPAGSINPVSLALLNLKGNNFGPGLGGGWLIPSVSAIPGTSRGRLVLSQVGSYRDDQGVLNLDKQIRASDHIAARGFFSDNSTYRPFGAGGTLAEPLLSPGKNWFATLSEQHVFGPTAVNEARFGFNRFFFANRPDEIISLSDIGATRGNMAQFPAAYEFILSGNFSIGTGVNDDRGGAFNTFTWADTFSKTWGKHAIRIGAEADRYQLNRYNNFATRGSVSFSSGAGNGGFQNFLLGNYLTGQAGSGFTRFYFRNTDFDAFIQDDWKVTPRLTLNLGVRWEPFAIAHEKDNLLTNLQGINDNLPAQFIFPADLKLRGLGTPGVTTCTYKDCRFWSNVAPRFGFAWDPTGSARWAVRGGYGIYYDRFSNQILLQSTGGGVFQQALHPTGPLTNPFPTLRPLSDFPLAPTPIPTFTGFDASGAPTWSGDTPGFLFFGDRNLKAPYTQQWNFTVQRQLGKDWVFETGYVGTKGSHLIFSNASFSLGQPATLANPLVQPGVGTITESTLANLDVRVPAKWLGIPAGNLEPITNDGSSIYHSWQTSLTRRFGNNFFQAAYTWSKSIDNESGSQADFGDELNGNIVWNGNQSLSRSVSDFDRPHRFTLSYAYEFPWFRHSNRLVHAVLGGWGTNGLVTIQSGYPFTVFDSGGGSLMGTDICCWSTAQLVSNKSYDQINGHGTVEKRLNSYFDVNAFAPAPCVNSQLQPVGPDSPACEGTLIGNSGRNILRAPLQTNIDFALFKRFYFTETRNLEFRAESFNFLNHPVFAAPGCGVGACSIASTDIQAGQAAAAITSTANRPRVLQFALKLNF